MLRRVLAVSNNFPTPRFPEKGVFVMNFLTELAAHGWAVDVIAPTSWLAELKSRTQQRHEVSFGPLRVVHPSLTMIPLRMKRAARIVASFNERRFRAAIERSLASLGGPYDFVYAHFLPTGRAVLDAVRRNLKTLEDSVFLNLGESDPWDYDDLYSSSWARELSRFAGVIAVSKRSYEYVLSRNAALEERLAYIPNGVNTNLFKPMNRHECREILRLPPAERIAIFCGHFDQRKGPLRVLDAIRRIGMKGVFLGSNGPDLPKGPDVVFAGPIQNSFMPLWYNAADVFVLPSLSEGMSNAILEALACGLPLVVADRDFNTSFLTRECARFVDPLDPAAIARGIEDCLSPSNYAGMCAASLRLAETYTVQRRVDRFLAFTNERIP